MALPPSPPTLPRRVIPMFAKMNNDARCMDNDAYLRTRWYFKVSEV